MCNKIYKLIGLTISVFLISASLFNFNPRVSNASGFYSNQFSVLNGVNNFVASIYDSVINFFITKSTTISGPIAVPLEDKVPSDSDYENIYLEGSVMDISSDEVVLNVVESVSSTNYENTYETPINRSVLTVGESPKYVEMDFFMNQVEKIFNSIQNSVSSNITSHIDTVSHGGSSGISFATIGLGGTGLSSTPNYGELLLGDGLGGYALVATSSLGLGGSAGTLTSIDITVPTGLTVSGGPITTSGTFAFDFESGYSLPLTASSTNWNSFYDAPSTQITAGTGLSWVGNTLNAESAGTVNSGASGAFSYYPLTGTTVDDQAILYLSGSNVGIGTTTPWRTLSVNGSSDLGNNALAGYFTATSSMASVFPYASSTALTVSGNAYFPGSGIWNSVGNVGVGTTTPLTQFHVEGTSAGISLHRTGGSEPFIRLSTNNYLTEGGQVRGIAGAAGLRFTNAFADVEWARFGPTGNFGIGTTTPSAKLAITGTGTGTGVTFRTANSSNIPTFNILDDGNVGIGTAAPNNRLDIVGDADNNSYVEVTNTNGTPVRFIFGTVGGTGRGFAGTIGAHPFDFRTDNTSRLTILPTSGNVGIGETSPGSKLSVSGNATIGSSYDTTAAPTNGLLVEGGTALGTNSNSALTEFGSRDFALRVDSTNFTGYGIVLERTDQTVNNGASVFALMRKNLSSAAVSNGNELGRIGGWGWDGDEYVLGSESSFVVDGTVSDQNVPTAFTVKTGTQNSTLAERFRITSSGNVGIGTTTPLAKLAVHSNSANFTPVTIGTNSTPVASFSDNLNDVSGVQMGNTNTGTGADFRFLIKDTTGHYFAFAQPGINNNVSPLLGQTRNTTDYIFNAGGTTRNLTIGTIDAKDLIFGTNNSEVVRVTSTGNVGIGTATPAARLQINSTDSSTAWFINTSSSSNVGGAGIVGLADDGSALSSGDRLGFFLLGGSLDGSGTRNNSAGITSFTTQNWSGSGAGANLQFLVQPNNTIGTANRIAAMTIDQNSNIGIGTTTPWAKLSVNNFSAAGNTAPLFAIASSTGSSATSTVFLVNSFGNVGIGTTTPWRKLSVDGTVALNGLTSTATGNALCITGNKEVTDSGGASCTPSSIRFKENITTLNPGFALDTISKFRVVNFDYREKQPYETNHSYGLIAEEIASIDNNLVDYGYDGQPVSLHFEKITGLLVQAVQEQKVQIEEIKSQSFIDKVLKGVTDSFAGAIVRMKSVFVGELHVQEKLCVDDVCIDKEQLKAILINSGGIRRIQGSPQVIDSNVEINNGNISTTTQSQATTTPNAVENPAPLEPTITSETPVPTVETIPVPVPENSEPVVVSETPVEQEATPEPEVAEPEPEVAAPPVQEAAPAAESAPVSSPESAPVDSQ